MMHLTLELIHSLLSIVIFRYHEAMIIDWFFSPFAIKVEDLEGKMSVIAASSMSVGYNSNRWWRLTMTPPTVGN